MPRKPDNNARRRSRVVDRSTCAWSVSVSTSTFLSSSCHESAHWRGDRRRGRSAAHLQNHVLSMEKIRTLVVGDVQDAFRRFFEIEMHRILNDADDLAVGLTAYRRPTAR